MKLLSLDNKKTSAVVEAQSVEDLWRLSTLIEAGDHVTTKTERKVKVNEDTVVRKTVVLTITVESVALQGDILRIGGYTTEGTDDIPKGSHHSFSISLYQSVTIGKEWLTWQLDKLVEQDSNPVLILLMDREEAVFAVLRREPEILSTIRGSVQKKGIDGGTPYWEELAKHLDAYNERIKPQHIIVASPAFFKEYVINILPEHLRKKTVAATISATGEAALQELIRRPEVKQVLAQERFTQENILVDDLMYAINKDLAAWGMQEVEELANTGALQTVLVTTQFINACRQNGTYAQLNAVMKTAESTKAQVHILDTTAAEKIDTLGGITAIRRW